MGKDTDLSLSDVRVFCERQVDPRLLTIGFKLLTVEDIAGVAHKRTFEKSGEPFLVDFYVEITDPSVNGLKIRRKTGPTYGGTYVRTLLGEAGIVLAGGACLTEHELSTQWRHEFVLLQRELDFIRGYF